MLARGVHVNITGPGLPPAGGHIGLVPNATGDGIDLVQVDKATKELTAQQWKKAQAATKEYLSDPVNVDRMEKAAQSGIDTFPGTKRAEQMKEVKDILKQHKTKGTCPC